MHPKFTDGSSITWYDMHAVRYGVVVRGTESLIDVVPVFRLDRDVKCYDEGGAVFSKHRHNVRLKDCPPPFSMLCSQSSRQGCFTVASTDTCFTLSDTEILASGVSFVADGEKISDRDMADILDHLWRDEKEKYVPPVRSQKMIEMMAKYELDEARRSAKPLDGQDYER